MIIIKNNINKQINSLLYFIILSIYEKTYYFLKRCVFMKRCDGYEELH